MTTGGEVHPRLSSINQSCRPTDHGHVNGTREMLFFKIVLKCDDDL